MSQDISSMILISNNQFIAFNKPAGLPVQADLSKDLDLLSMAQMYTKHPLHLVNRLDRPVSGIVLFAKNKKTASALSDQFVKKEIFKSYLALSKNKPETSEGIWKDYLNKNSKTKKAYVSDKNKGQLAEMSYKILGSSDNYNLFELKPKSGRFHQIRCQMAHHGCPIKGDVKYGARRANKDRSIHLHAWKLNFQHPISKEKIELIAELPEDNLWNFAKSLI